MANPVVTADEQQFVSGFQAAVETMEGFMKTLRTMDPSALKASVALEYSQEAKRYLEAVENSELRSHVSHLYQEHRRASDWLKRVKKPAEILLKYCSDIRSDWEMERRRRIEADRREREQQANLFAAQQKEAEVTHLREIGKTAEANAKAAAEVIPITVNVNADAGKPQGEVMVEVWQPERDQDGNIVFSDLVSYLAWIAGNPAFYMFIKHEFGRLKKWLTANRGMVIPPGLKVEHKFEARTRRAADDGDLE